MSQGTFYSPSCHRCVDDFLSRGTGVPALRSSPLIPQLSVGSSF